MQFNYDYKEELEARNVGESVILTPGQASFKVKAVHDTDKQGKPLLTKGGEPKIRIDVFVTDMHNSSTIIYEHITAKTGWKLGQILKAIGKGYLYSKEGSLDPRHLVSGTGQCMIKTKADPGYPVASVVDKYMMSATTAPMEELPPLHVYTNHAQAGFGDDRAEDPFEDSIPF